MGTTAEVKMWPKGFVRLPRELFDDQFFFPPGHVFTRFEAWLDLAQRARAIARLKELRGQLRSGLDDFAQRWKWTVAHVRRFLDAMIQRYKRLGRPIAPTHDEAAVYEVLVAELGGRFK